MKGSDKRGEGNMYALPWKKNPAGAHVSVPLDAQSANFTSVTVISFITVILTLDVFRRLFTVSFLLFTDGVIVDPAELLINMSVLRRA